MEVDGPQRGRGPAASLLARGLALAAFVALSLADGAGASDVASPTKVLRVATSGDYAPFSFPAPAGTPEPGLEGFDLEVARLFARERGYTVEFVRFRWPDLGRELAAGNFDIAMSGVTMRPERSIAGRFSVPVATSHAVAVTWKGSGATDFKELDVPNRRVAVNAGGHLEKVANDVFRRAVVIPIPDNDAVRMALLDRTFDAVVTDNYEEKVWTATTPDAVRFRPLSDDRKAYLLPADRAELALELDRWLLTREADGTLAGLRSRHLDGPPSSDEKPPQATAEPLAALSAAIVERLALMPMVYAAKKRDGKPVEDKAQEAAVLDAAVRAVAAEASAVEASAGRVANAHAPATGAVDPEAVRSLFQALIAMGKDAQQKLADLDARRRPGVVRRRPDAAAGAKATGGAAVSAEGSPPADEPPARSRERVYSLADDLRPAIGRITSKVASILVAMRKPITVTQARRHLGNALAPHAVGSTHVDAMANAVARISSR
ncbi:MAG: transporter substrate-binding domain-containing protein [Candidatus Binatia bacterium]